MKEIIKQLKKENFGKILCDEPLSKYTTFKVGGLARCIIFPSDEKKLVKLIKYLKINSIKHMILGYGSNVVFSDKPYEGVIIKLDELKDIKIDEKRGIITASSGVSLIKLSMMAARYSLTGLEFASGIPGTLGGAIYMNAGAYKSDMGYITTKVKVLTPDFRIITFVNKELDFHYRSSFFQKHKDYVILEATLKLAKGKKDAIMEVIKERKEKRLSTQPLEYPSAGSVFRNPEGMFAGKLIEDLGLKGLTKGGAQISTKHANFIINVGGAKASDIKELITFIKEAVYDNYKVELKVEQEFVNWE